jgi:RHS repeat-associated protein
MSPYTYNLSNELVSIFSGSYTYDKNGNTKTKPDGTQYTWDIENELTQVVLPNSGGTANFKYDPFGRRIQKTFTQGSTTTTINYLYDGANLIEELDSGGNIVTRYTQEPVTDEQLSELRSGATNYYEADGLGSITSLSNGTGTLANTYTYDSYGKLTASTGTITNSFQYTGREFDSETGLLFNRARYLDLRTGRFLSEDPIRYRGGVNFYTYTRNNPIIRTDPFGHEGCNAEQWAQSPHACAGPTDPNAPYQGPDGLWYNTDPTPLIPSDGPTPANPPEPNKCKQPSDQRPPDVPKPPDPIRLVPAKGSCTDAVSEFGLGVGGTAITAGLIALAVYTGPEAFVGFEGLENMVHLSPLAAPGLTLMGQGAIETIENCF